MNNIGRLLILAVFSLLARSPLCAQQSAPPCSEMKYEHHNMIDYGPLRVSVIRGSVMDFQGVAVPNACVGIFSDTDQKLIATGKVDSEGLFEIPSIPSGKYRLIVAYDGFCAANVSIVLKNRLCGKKKLLAIMKPGEVDVCSYVEWK